MRKNNGNYIANYALFMNLPRSITTEKMPLNKTIMCEAQRNITLYTKLVTFPVLLIRLAKFTIFH